MLKNNKVLKAISNHLKGIEEFMRALIKLITLVFIILTFLFSNKINHPGIRAGLITIISILVGIIIMIFITSAIKQSIEDPKLKMSRFLKYFFL